MDSTWLMVVVFVVFALLAAVRAGFSGDRLDWVSPAVGLLFAGIVFVCG